MSKSASTTLPSRYVIESAADGLLGGAVSDFTDMMLEVALRIAVVANRELVAGVPCIKTSDMAAAAVVISNSIQLGLGATVRGGLATPIIEELEEFCEDLVKYQNWPKIG